MKTRYLCLSLFIFSVIFLMGCNKETAVETTESNVETSESNVNTRDFETKEENVQEYITMKEPSRQSFGYMTSLNDEIIYDRKNLELPGYVDVLSFSKHVSDDDVYIYIELRDLPDTFLVNQEGLNPMQFEYSWRINFDTNRDNDIVYDVTVAHHKFRGNDTTVNEVGLQHESFESVVLQQQVSSDYLVSDFDFSIEDNTMVFHFLKNQNDELMLIYEDTPFHILTEYNGKNMYLYELIPIKKNQ